MAAPSVLKWLMSGRWLRPRGDRPAGRCKIPADFFGICVASGDDSASDDYMSARLKELGLRNVRLDLTYGFHGRSQERFLRRLLEEEFRICLHLVPPQAEMAQMRSSSLARENWRAFVAEILAEFGRAAVMVEIGSTCNRRKWSGGGLADYLAAWQTAAEVALTGGYPLAAPNVSDFEPVYNIAVLSAMRRMGAMPAVHTDNLYVERAVEPEAFDHKIAGRSLAGILRFNLIRKARTLGDISSAFGIDRTVCAHVSWSLRRIRRFLDDAEQKQADYLARYCILAAASGALDRVYWGPMIGQREGLIDDGTTEYPDLPHVAYYGRARGTPESYRIRPAFAAFRTVNSLLAGAEYVRKIPSGYGLEMHEFLTSGGLLHACWCMDGHRALAAACYGPGFLAKARCLELSGTESSAPEMFSESPVYLCWDGEKRVSNDIPGMLSGAGRLRPLRDIRFSAAGMDYSWFRRGGQAGVCRSGSVDELAGLVDDLAKGVAAKAEILRDSRNRVWRSPLHGGGAAVVKRFRAPSLFRRIMSSSRLDRALRSWNGAHELLRRGIATPRPIAFIHRERDPRGAESWYICEDFARSSSAREAFNAFSRGAGEHLGVKAGEFFDRCALFLKQMHDRGVYFRDLSAGNLLCRTGSGDLEFAVIDTARAVFHPRPAGLRERICDLMRVCHPLSRDGRLKLVARYMALTGRRYRAWMEIPFAYYNAKHKLKGRLKFLRGRPRL